ncbi:Cytochrome c oxidase, subunit VIb superfamily [Fusarium oxysporum f. sp. vasinfectum]|nr:Cytochrome c oxidase, subunit VIb superfamily [Fusarium oxysporum f. sp. vasinfectum]
MSDDGQELVTKPFKFVTGMFNACFPDNPAVAGKPESLDQHHHYHRFLLDDRLRLRDPGTDARFPNQNQTKHCWQNYVDYHKCILAKGEDFAPCRQFWLSYRSLCPSGWYQRWDEQREAGNFPVKLDA